MLIKVHQIILTVFSFFIFTFCSNQCLDEKTKTDTSTSYPNCTSKSSITELNLYQSLLEQSSNSKILDRNETLKKSLKGYREKTYWGNEHPTNEKVKYYNDDQFNRYINDEITSKDVDVYWGTKY